MGMCSNWACSARPPLSSVTGADCLLLHGRMRGAGLHEIMAMSQHLAEGGFGLAVQYGRLGCGHEPQQYCQAHSERHSQMAR